MNFSKNVIVGKKDVGFSLKELLLTKFRINLSIKTMIEMDYNPMSKIETHESILI